MPVLIYLYTNASSTLVWLLVKVDLNLNKKHKSNNHTLSYTLNKHKKPKPQRKYETEKHTILKYESMCANVQSCTKSFGTFVQSVQKTKSRWRHTTQESNLVQFLIYKASSRPRVSVHGTRAGPPCLRAQFNRLLSFIPDKFPLLFVL